VQPEFRDDWPEGETGRLLVTLRAGSPAAKGMLFRELAGQDIENKANPNLLGDHLSFENGNASYFPNIAVAVVDAPHDKRLRLQELSGRADVLAVEPERYGHALHAVANPVYQDGYRNTWGLDATGAANSSWTGAGVCVAVLDSGIDLGHPNFSPNLTKWNFVEPGRPAQDGFWHGTHVAGTICGHRVARQGHIGFGVAPDVRLVVGKVLNDNGGYRDGDVLAGIDWAIRSGADIIVMSLGAAYFSPDWVQAYEQAANLALAQGRLVIAAAGNARLGTPRLPVFSPANCPSIMAVGAIDHRLASESYSSFGPFRTPRGVDIAGPGEDVLSTVPGADRFDRRSGTSMAAPHVAGCAALWASAEGLRGKALWDRLCATARKLGETPDFVGYGLVQAPP
jgi:subtilisin family serine protease